MHALCALQDEPVQTEESGMHEEDIDAELEALAMAYVRKPVVMLQTVSSFCYVGCPSGGVKVTV